MVTESSLKSAKARSAIVPVPRVGSTVLRITYGRVRILRTKVHA